MEKEYTYEWIRFSAEVLKEAADTLLDGVELKDKDTPPGLHLSVQLDEGSWNHDNEEELFSDYRRSSKHAVYSKSLENHKLWVQSFPNSVLVHVNAPERSKFRRYLTSLTSTLMLHGFRNLKNKLNHR